MWFVAFQYAPKINQRDSAILRKITAGIKKIIKTPIVHEIKRRSFLSPVATPGIYISREQLYKMRIDNAASFVCVSFTRDALFRGVC